MDHYVNIRIRPDPEFPATHLMNALYAKLHRALVQLGTGDIGISFPEHTAKRLGERLRLHGTPTSLTRLMGLGWLCGMHDHIEQSPIKSVPAKIKHRCVQRVQAKSSPERLRRRLMKRKGVSAAEATKLIPDNVAETLSLPYLQLASRSTGQRFRLFVRHGPLHKKPVIGCFSSYGFSGETTVPWF